MNNIFFLLVTLILSLNLLFNQSIADEVPVTATEEKQSTATEEKQSLEKSQQTETSATSQETDTETENQPPRNLVKDLSPKNLAGKMPELEKTVDQYMTAWHKQDLKTLRTFESWEGGEALDEIKYIQSFRSDFKIKDWKITQIQLEEENEYKVLVNIAHNPPPFIAPYLKGKNQTVRSTLIQWWKKQGDQFVHLFHIERQRLIKLHTPPSELLPHSIPKQ